MPSVSITDWLNSQCSDRLISAVLIGQVALKWRHRTGQPTARKPTSTLIVHSKNHSHIRTYDAQYTLPHNVHAQQSNLGNTRSPVTLLDRWLSMTTTIEQYRGISICACIITYRQNIPIPRHNIFCMNAFPLQRVVLYQWKNEEYIKYIVPWSRTVGESYFWSIFRLSSRLRSPGWHSTFLWPDVWSCD